MNSQPTQQQPLRLELDYNEVIAELAADNANLRRELAITRGHMKAFAKVIDEYRAKEAADDAAKQPTQEA